MNYEDNLLASTRLCGGFLQDSPTTGFSIRDIERRSGGEWRGERRESESEVSALLNVVKALEKKILILESKSVTSNKICREVGCQTDMSFGKHRNFDDYFKTKTQALNQFLVSNILLSFSSLFSYIIRNRR